MKPQDAPQLREWMLASDVAATLGVSRQTVNVMIQRGEFETLHTLGASGPKVQFCVARGEVERIQKTRTFRSR